MSNLTSPTWWRAAGLRALHTAIAIAAPYLGATVVADVPWVTALAAATLGAIASLATSLAGLPEVAGTDLPWWLAALERVTKTFAQSLAAGLVGAVVLTDVDWLLVLQASALSALISLLRLILSTLPADPSTTPPKVVTINGPVTVDGRPDAPSITDAAALAADAAARARAQ